MTGTKRVRLIDIAEHCGVSKASVVQALSRPPERCELSVETRTRIRAAAAELGYRPDWRARALAGGRTRTVGLLYDSIYPPMGGYPTVQMGGLARRLAERGHDLLLVQSRDERSWRERLAERRVDGAVVIDRAPPGLLESPERLPVPVVLMNLEAPVSLPQVLLDDMAIAGCAARHLIGLGHRHIAYCRSDTEHASDLLRQAGCQAAVSEAGGRCRLTVIHGVSEAVAVLERDDQRPTAIVAYADSIAAEILHLALARGLRVPGDLSLVGINDDPIAGHTSPALTTVALPHDPFGFAAADLLLDLIEGLTPAETRILLPGRLVTRRSAAPPG